MTRNITSACLIFLACYCFAQSPEKGKQAQGSQQPLSLPPRAGFAGHAACRVLFGIEHQMSVNGHAWMDAHIWASEYYWWRDKGFKKNAGVCLLEKPIEGESTPLPFYWIVVLDSSVEQTYLGKDTQTTTRTEDVRVSGDVYDANSSLPAGTFEGTIPITVTTTVTRPYVYKGWASDSSAAIFASDGRTVLHITKSHAPGVRDLYGIGAGRNERAFQDAVKFLSAQMTASEKK